MRANGGFTVLETLIVLTISVIMAITILAMFSQRQGRVQFSQGIREVESYIQDVANDVRNGYYTPISNQTCDEVGGVIAFSPVADVKQGSSNKCIFAGKAIVINSTSPDSSVISTYTLAGLKSAKTVFTLKPVIAGTAKNETKIDYTMATDIKIKTGTLDGGDRLLMIVMLFDVEKVGVDSSSTKRIASVKPYVVNLTDVALTDVTVNSAITLAFASSSSGLFTEIKDNPINLCFEGSDPNTDKAIISMRAGVDNLSTNLLINQNLTGCTT